MSDWLPMETAPKDGTRIIILVRHMNWQYAREHEKAMWQQECEAHWIDHNGGGFTWYGVCGNHIGWRPLAPIADGARGGNGRCNASGNGVETPPAD